MMTSQTFLVTSNRGLVVIAASRGLLAFKENTQ